MRPQRVGSAVVAALVGLCMFCSGCGAASIATVPLTESSGVWAPDSQSIARPGKGGIEIANPLGEKTELIPISTPSRGLGWSADSHTVFFLSKEPHQKPDRTERVVRARIGGDIASESLGTHAAGIAWSRGGWPLAFTTAFLYFDPYRGPVGPHPALWTMSDFRQKPRRILDMPGEEEQPSWSPDGRTILFALSQKQGVGIWLVRADGSGRRRLAGGLSSASPSWSPDGQWVALAATTDTGDRRRHLYIVPAAGGQLRELSSEELGAGVPPAWTPDGHWIAYATQDGKVMRVRPDGSDTETIATFPGKEVGSLSWSPDGERLAYTAWSIPESD